MFLTFNVNCLLIAFISATTLEVCLPSPSVSRFVNHFCNIWIIGSSKQEVMVLAISSLFSSMMIKESVILSISSQILADLISILSDVFSDVSCWRNNFNQKENKMCISQKESFNKFRFRLINRLVSSWVYLTVRIMVVLKYLPLWLNWGPNHFESRGVASLSIQFDLLVIFFSLQKQTYIKFVFKQ